jgi:alkanesulfonate monooxygenase SsuD/methylene tetrahydromethanopterin reductase-like flavin-dependent oxidoreductase (luciferase family)
MAATDRAEGGMRISLGMMFQNYADWDRYLALERGEPVGEMEAPDWKAWRDHLEIFSQAEDLGFDALWSVEHHFTPYCLIPDPLQLLTYFAGRTKRIDLGTMVCVLPWWNPVKLAEEITMLQTILGDDRDVYVGVGRGLGRREYESIGIDMDESRGRYQEVLDVLRQALTNERFSFDGEYFTIPETSLRPRPKNPDRLLANMHGAWGSPPSIRVVAENGLRPFLNPQKPLENFDEDLAEYRKVREEHGLEPARPTIVLFGYCAETQEQALADATKYSSEYRETSYLHYELGGAHLANLKTYSYYAHKPPEPTLENLFFIHQIVGSPDECIRRIEQVHEKYECPELILQMVYGGMPASAAEKSIQLFGKEVIPAVHEMKVTEPVAGS